MGVVFSKDKAVIKPLATGCGLMMFTMLAGVLGQMSVAIMFINVPIQTYIQKATLEITFPAYSQL